MNEKKRQDEEMSSWDGEEIALERTWGDQWLQGLLGWRVTIPANHVHPQVREAGVRVQAAQAEYDGLAQELATRPGERQQLTQKLLQESASREEIGRQLRAFDDDTAGVEVLVPVAMQRVYDAWDDLCDAVRANDEEWQEIFAGPRHSGRHGASRGGTGLHDGRGGMSADRELAGRCRHRPQGRGHAL
jgi:hypothetical protein